MDMADARKVYFATGKDLDTRSRIFRTILGNDFNLADRAAEAEFIVLDCDDPPLPRDWVNQKPTFVVPDPCYPPIILASLGGNDHQPFLTELRRDYDGDPTDLHVCQTEADLLQTLKRFQATLPFYNTRNTPPPDNAKVREMTLSAVKLLLEGGIK
jgi:hypothetical protein